MKFLYTAKVCGWMLFSVFLKLKWLLFFVWNFSYSVYCKFLCIVNLKWLLLSYLDVIFSFLFWFLFNSDFGTTYENEFWSCLLINSIPHLIAHIYMIADKLLALFQFWFCYWILTWVWSCLLINSITILIVNIYTSYVFPLFLNHVHTSICLMSAKS